MRRARRWTALAASALVGAVSAGLCVGPADPAVAADPVPDYAFFKERIEPVLQSVCAQCHAGKGKGAFGLIVHAEGAPFPDAEHKVNFNTVVKLLVPGKPAESKFLQKPLGEKGGGVKHGGNERIFKGTAAYRAWTDFIEGVKGTAAPSTASTPATPEGQPDFGFFLARIEPVLLNVCSQCHAGAGRGAFALITHVGGTRFPIADHRKNFEGVLKLVTPKKPMESRFFLKPLAEKDGGSKHGGNDRISKGDANYQNWIDFINGVKGPPVPTEEVPEEETLPTVMDKGLVLQAEDMTARGDVAPASPDGAVGKVIAPGAGGGRLSGRFRVGRSTDYSLSFRVAGGARGLRVRVDGGEPMDVGTPREGWADVAPSVALDNGKPLEARLGRLTVEDAALHMDGREGTARWLSPADLPHTSVSTKISLPSGDDAGLVDAWLLFDCLDAENGKFVGISDGGRKFVMGVLEGGRPRVLTSKPKPPELKGETLGVDLLNGVAVGRLDGKPLLSVNFDRNLGAARFGFLTHGLVTVREMTARTGLDEVARMRLSVGSVVHLRRGVHTLEFELLPSGAALDAATVKEITP